MPRPRSRCGPVRRPPSSRRRHAERRRANPPRDMPRQLSRRDPAGSIGTPAAGVQAHPPLNDQELHKCLSFRHAFALALGRRRGSTGRHADRPVRARHRAEHRHDSAPRRLPRRRGAYRRTGRLPGLRPRLPQGRNGLPRPGCAHAASVVAGVRGVAARRRRATGAVFHPGGALLSGTHVRRRGRPDVWAGIAGVPPQVHAAADARLVIPIRAGLRSLNVAMACAMAVGEALRQTGPIAAK